MDEAIEAIKKFARLEGVSIRAAAAAAALSYDRAQRVLRGERAPRPGEIERLIAAVQSLAVDQ